MIITKTPYRVSFVGGGTDLKSFYSIVAACPIEPAPPITKKDDFATALSKASELVKTSSAKSNSSLPIKLRIFSVIVFASSFQSYYREYYIHQQIFASSLPQMSKIMLLECRLHSKSQSGGRHYYDH